MRTYVANLASFINIARSYDIRVLIALMPLPFHGGYLPDQAAYTTKGSAKYHNLNLYYIDANYLAAQKRYVSDLITGLTGAGANMSDIFSLELIGEVVFNRTQWPLNMNSGLVQTDGRIQPYDMSDPSSRNDLIDQNTLNWENQLTDAIHAQLPSVLVSVGYFTPYALVRFPQTPRISRPESSFSSESDVNFVDIHMYPIFGPIVDQINSLGVSLPASPSRSSWGSSASTRPRPPRLRPQPRRSPPGSSRVATSKGWHSPDGSPGHGIPSPIRTVRPLQHGGRQRCHRVSPFTPAPTQPLSVVRAGSAIL